MSPGRLLAADDGPAHGSPGAPLPPLCAVVGTTASGKSALAVDLAQRVGGEIVSADSRQVYRGLDIGTGKTTPAEQRGVRHHLLDVADVRSRFTVAEYQSLALATLDEVWDRGVLPILVGGTGLYVRAVIDNPTYPAVAPDPTLRAQLERRPLPDLVATLRRLDPVGAERIDRANPRRVVRALEVTLGTGVPFSAQQRHGPARARALQLGVTWPAEELRQRIDERLDARLATGLVEEVLGLLADGVPAARLLELGLEYRFVARYLQGALAYDAMVADLKLAIRQYAKRQLTWFRRDPRVRWLDMRAADPLAEATALVLGNRQG